MKKIAIFLFLLVSFVFIWLTACNDKIDYSASDALSPQLSTADDSATSGILTLKKLDSNIPGDPFTTPENFVVITPVKWDGISKLKPGVHYRLTAEQFDKLPELGEKFRKFHNGFMAFKNSSYNAEKKKSTNPRLAWAFARANCIGNGLVYGEAQAQGNNGAMAAVNIDDTPVDFMITQGTDTAFAYGMCVSGCNSCLVYGDDLMGGYQGEVCF